MYETLQYRFWALLDAIVRDDSTAQIISLKPNETRVVLGKNRLFVILLDEMPKERVALQNWQKVLVEENAGAREIDVVVLAPSAEVDEALSENQLDVPWTTRLAVFTVNQFGEYHEITNKQADNFSRKMLQHSLETRATIDELKSSVQLRLMEQGRKSVEVSKFRDRLMGDSAAATYALLAAIFAYFGIQLWFGSATYAPGLLLLGADSTELVKQGQYWRLFTSMFLHAGYLHIAMNSYVLYALGAFFNKIVGNARFLILYFASGLVGSLASVYINQSPLSVGASGALWGLFGVSAALIIRPSGFLPDSVRANLRNVTIFNLLINIGFSFAVPMIDKWAHFGGGAAGFLIGVAFVFEPEYKARRLVHNFLAFAFTAMAVLSFAANWYFEQPWTLYRPIKLVDQKLFDGDLAIGIPSFLRVSMQSSDHSRYGDFQVSPYQIDVYRGSSLAPLSKVSVEDEARLTARQALDGLKYNITKTDYREINGYKTAAISGDFELEHETGHFWVWVQARNNDILTLHILSQPDTPEILFENLGQIVETIGSSVKI